MRAPAPSITSSSESKRRATSARYTGSNADFSSVVNTRGFCLWRNVIALWHDESQINRYILFRKDFRVLTPAFCYPEGWDHLPFPCIIRIRSKARYIDIPALRKDAPETKLSPAVARWNHFAMRAARWTQNHIFKKGS